MKINILQNSRTIKVFLFAVIAALVISCNKELPNATPIIYPPVNNSSTSIGAAINSKRISFPPVNNYTGAAQPTGIITAGDT